MSNGFLTFFKIICVSFFNFFEIEPKHSYKTLKMSKYE